MDLSTASPDPTSPTSESISNDPPVHQLGAATRSNVVPSNQDESSTILPVQEQVPKKMTQEQISWVSNLTGMIHRYLRDLDHLTRLAIVDEIEHQAIRPIRQERPGETSLQAAGGTPKQTRAETPGETSLQATEETAERIRLETPAESNVEAVEETPGQNKANVLYDYLFKAARDLHKQKQIEAPVTAAEEISTQTQHGISNDETEGASRQPDDHLQQVADEGLSQVPGETPSKDEAQLSNKIPEEIPEKTQPENSDPPQPQKSEISVEKKGKNPVVDSNQAMGGSEIEPHEKHPVVDSTQAIGKPGVLKPKKKDPVIDTNQVVSKPGVKPKKKVNKRKFRDDDHDKEGSMEMDTDGDSDEDSESTVQKISSAMVVSAPASRNLPVSTVNSAQVMIDAATNSLNRAGATEKQKVMALEVMTMLLSRDTIMRLYKFFGEVRANVEIISIMRERGGPMDPDDQTDIIELKRFYIAVSEFQYVEAEDSNVDLQHMRMLDEIANSYADLITRMAKEQDVENEMRRRFEKYRTRVNAGKEKALVEHSAKNTVLCAMTSMQRPNGSKMTLQNDKTTLQNRIRQGDNLIFLKETFGEGAWGMLMHTSWRSRLRHLNPKNLTAAVDGILGVEPNLMRVFEPLTRAIQHSLYQRTVPPHRLVFELMSVTILRNGPNLTLTDLLAEALEDHDMKEVEDDEDAEEEEEEEGEERQPQLMLGGSIQQNVEKVPFITDPEDD